MQLVKNGVYVPKYRITVPVHGGSAINLFYKDMPRYSVDIDLTYIPIKPRQESLDDINNKLSELKGYIERSVPGMHIIPKPKVWKLQCTLGSATVKIEVNGTKRGLLGETVDKHLCKKAQEEFQMTCVARTEEELITKEQLLDAFIRSANSESRPSVNSWKQRWHEIADTIAEMNIQLPHYDEDKQYIDSILSAGKYAISHSPDYRETYHPHYRIICKDIFKENCVH